MKITARNAVNNKLLVFFIVVLYKSFMNIVLMKLRQRPDRIFNSVRSFIFQRNCPQIRELTGVVISPDEIQVINIPGFEPLLYLLSSHIPVWATVRSYSDRIRHHRDAEIHLPHRELIFPGP
jgi:hypothetical protein